MQSDIRPLSVMCSYFQQFNSNDLKKTRKKLRFVSYRKSMLEREVQMLRRVIIMYRCKISDLEQCLTAIKKKTKELCNVLCARSIYN